MIGLVLAVLISGSAGAAVNGEQVAYVGGSLAGVASGEVGHFDTTEATDLLFVTTGAKVPIGYTKIIRVEYSTEVTYHLGVAPAIAVGLLKQRERKHFLTLTYVDQAGVRQAAVFEVAKDSPRALVAVLSVRAPQACVVATQFAARCPPSYGTGVPPNQMMRQQGMHPRPPQTTQPSPPVYGPEPGSQPPQTPASGGATPRQ
jgi:hypothetical protein